MACEEIEKVKIIYSMGISISGDCPCSLGLKDHELCGTYKPTCIKCRIEALEN